MFPEGGANTEISPGLIPDERSYEGIARNVPNSELCHHAPAPPTTLSIKVVIVVLY